MPSVAEPDRRSKGLGLSAVYKPVGADLRAARRGCRPRVYRTAYSERPARRSGPTSLPTSLTISQILQFVGRSPAAGRVGSGSPGRMCSRLAMG